MLLVTGLAAAAALDAQAPAVRDSVWVAAPLVGGLGEERERLAQLAGDSTAGFMLRSLSSRIALPADARLEPAWGLLVPEVTWIRNSALPFSMNDGALWAGRGRNLRITAGMAAAWGPARVVLMPALVSAANDDYTVIDLPTYWAPPLDPRYSPYASPWNQYPYALDLPTRFGDERIHRLDWGQSALWVEGEGIAAGLSTENQWWGPGIRNALLLSNNAGGFPHAFLRTARPIVTSAGTFEARWIAGALRESAFYDTLPANDHRSLSAAAVTWSPPGERGLTLGLARMVIAPARNGAQPFARWFDVFANTGRPNAVPRDPGARFPIADSATAPGRDQLLSLFARWVFPADGFELYGELGRAEMPVNLRDLFVEPTHSFAYTAGFQYLRPLPALGGALRLQGELTSLEQSPSYRHRPIGSWYTSLAVRQGFTHRGQVLGAAIGPGSSGQFMAADYVAPEWGAGAYVGRQRWNNDANLLMPFPVGSGWCEHDVTLYPGVRGHYSRAGIGTVQVDVALPNRLNAFFQNKSGCPNGAFMRDVRSRFVSITLQPWAELRTAEPRR